MAYSIRLPDGALVENIPDEVTPEAAKAKILRARPDLASQERTWGEAAKDVGAGLVSGVGSLVQLPGQLYGLATGDFAKTGALGLGEDISKYGEEMKSAGLKAREAARAVKVQEAEQEGQLSAFMAALGETVKDPALLTSFLAEQAPQLIPMILSGVGAGAIASRGVMSAAAARGAAEEAAKRLATKKAVQAGTTAAIQTGAVIQGADIGAGTYDEIYKGLIANGIPPERAAEETINRARLAGVAGYGLSLLANRYLPGGKALEEVLAGKRLTGTRLGTAAVTGLKEIPGENIEEVGGRIAQNIAAQSAGLDRDILSGTGETAAMATIGAAGMGGGAGLLAGRARTPEVVPPPAPVTEEKPEEPQATAVPTTARTMESFFEEKKPEPAKTEPTTVDELRTAYEAGVTREAELRNKPKGEKTPEETIELQQIHQRNRALKKKLDDAIAQAATQGATDVAGIEQPAGGAGAPVPAQPAAELPAAKGAVAPEPAGMVPAGPDVAVTPEGEGREPTAVTPTVTVRELALQEQKAAGWNPEWPFVPADLGNSDFRQLIRDDSSLTPEVKQQIFESGYKLGVVPKNEVTTVQPTGEPLGTQAPQTVQAETQGQEAPAAPAVEPRQELLTKRKAQAEALGIDLRDIQQDEINAQLEETEKRIGQKFDEERKDVVYDEDAQNFIEEAEKGNLSPQFGWEGEKLGAFADMLDRNGVDSEALLGRDVDVVPENVRTAKLQEALDALQGKREQLRSWDRLTEDQKRVYLDNLTTNELGQITPLARQRALEALNRYTTTKTRTPSGEVRADRVEGLYETQRTAYQQRTGTTLPKYSELTQEERDQFKADLKFRKRDNKLIDPTVENIDQAFSNLAVSQAEKKTQREAAEKEAQKREGFEAYKQAQGEIAAAQEQRKKTPSRTGPTERIGSRFIPNAAAEQVKAGNTANVLNYLRTQAKSKLHRVIAQAISNLKLKTKIQYVDSLPKGRLAEYDPKTDTIFVTAEGLTDAILLHEFVHAATVKVLDQYEKGNLKGLSEEQIEAAEMLDDLMGRAKAELGTRYPDAFENLLEFVSYALTDKFFQEDLAGIQMRFPQGKKIVYFPSILPELRSAWSEFMLNVLKALNVGKSLFKGNETDFDKRNALMEVFQAFETIAEAPTERIERAPLPAKKPVGRLQPKTEEQLKRDDSLENIRKKNELPELSTVSNIRRQYTGRKAYNLLKKKFQNSRDAIKRVEDAATRAGKVIFDGPKLNAVYNSIVRASGIARDLFLTRVEPSAAKLRKAINDYAKKTGQSIEEATRDLHIIAMAKHEGERRDVLYMLNVPLSNKTAAITLPNGKVINMAPSEYRTKVMEAIFSGELSKADVVALRKSLDTVVAQHVDPLAGISGFGPDAAPIDIGKAGKEGQQKYMDALRDRNSYLYSSVGGYSPEVLQNALDKLYTKETKGVADAALKAMKGLHEATRELDKESNYWSKPVQSVVDFYGWENYIPLKGKQKFEGKNGDMLDFDGPRLGKDYQESQNQFEGRQTDSDNSLIQSMVDATRAAMRAGRKDVTLAIKNAVNDKLLHGKVVKEKIPFADRLSIPSMMVKTESGSEVPITGPNFVFHYNPDGTIDVIQLSDKEQREAIKRTYQDSQPLIDSLNWLTSKVGQMHTRYNVAFAPMNFVRDALTNAFMLGSDMGPKVAAQYIGAIAAKVVNGGMFKALRVAQLYERGKFDEIARLAQKDSYVAAMYDYIQEGGKVSYLQGISSKSQQQELQRDLSSSNLKKAGAAVNKVLDIWNDMFELASRTAAYEITKSQEMAKGLDAKAASKKAAGYAKNLANFEQTGEWGRAAGAMFMFFRPAATGAVRAIEALEPMFRSEESALADLPASMRDPKNPKNAEALKKFKADYAQQKRNAQAMTLGLLGMGAAIYGMAFMMADDDDQGRNRVATDDAARWSRYARFFIPGMETPIQIPWGFGLGAFAAAGGQLASIGMGNTTIKEALTNIALIGMDSFLPLPVSRIDPMEKPAAWLMDSALPSALRPFLEWTMNVDGLGREIYNNRQSRYGDAYTGGDNIPEAYKTAARMLYDATTGAVDVSPNTLYFFANNYLDGISRLGAGVMNIGMVGAGNKEFNPKTDTVLFDSFFGAPSNIDARQFSNAEKKILSIQQRMKTLQANHPDKYADYISDNPTHPFIVDSYNRQVNQTLRDLREQANKYRRMPELTVKERTELVKNIVGAQNLVKRNILNMMDALELDY